MCDPAAASSAASGDECEEAVVLLPAGRAALEMCAKPGDRRIRIGAGCLELDVAIELVEAGIATDLRLGRPEHAREHVLHVAILHQSSSHAPSTARPHSSRCPRSLRRASCSVL